MANYVKFRRGTEAAWAALEAKDADTLYFIYESASSEIGKLYLGEKLISSSIPDSTQDILDLFDQEGLTDGSFLIYDGTAEEWKVTTLAGALASIGVFTGAAEETAGASGLVPAPAAGDQNKFLRGDGTWASVTEAVIEWEDLPAAAE